MMSADESARMMKLSNSINVLEKKVDMIMNHLNLHYTDTAPKDLQYEIGALIRAGNKIEAIKRYREQTGVGLAEAKNAVEEMERNM
jgi:ribosomal protein L7/L12